MSLDRIYRILKDCSHAERENDERTKIMNDRVFIEEQFPVSKVSKESYKERKAGASQTLTSLGKWWGRKPLILVRAAIIGMLMPVSADPKKDRDIFLKILTMDDHGLWLRRSKAIPAKVVKQFLTPDEWAEICTDEEGNQKRSWSTGLDAEVKNAVLYKVFARMSYDEKLVYCDRPEQIAGPDKQTWREINAHLGTQASNLQELTAELGKRRFGHVPKIGDAFCGGGSIPFEAARLGCEAYGSDLNPVAALLTWASIHLIGGGQEIQQKVQEAQQMAFAAADKQITDWGIEHNDKDWRADAYLYCVETRCPATGLMLPLAPSWIISEKYRVCAVLKRNNARQGYDIDIITNADQQTFDQAKKGTVQGGRMVCPETGESFSIASIRGDRKVDGETTYGLRLWENDDLVPRPDDVFQERLYCVRWVETYKTTNRQDKEVEKTLRHYCSVSDVDLAREEKVLNLLKERFADWQDKGYLPSRKIERGGEKTEEPIRTRGWTYWHHLFNPRQLLNLGLIAQLSANLGSINRLASMIWITKVAERYARIMGWDASRDGTSHVFTDQALNAFYNIGSKSFYGVKTIPFVTVSYKLNKKYDVQTIDARNISWNCNIWMTDPPYADAINYHELTSFFLAWYEKLLQKTFPDWYTDTRKALAVRGSGQDFKQSMVEIYHNLTKHMPNNGMQLVMFTHQDASVWADLAMILWAAGLRVTTAWTIATETTSGLKKGNYVQGTVLLVLRKRNNHDSAFLDELYPEIEDEVRRQLDHMLELEDREDPNFADTDYQLAAYAAALRVLTGYSEIEGHDIRHELFRELHKGEQSAFEQVIDRAVEIASDHLVPQGLERCYWKILSAPERLYLKGLELEKHLEARSGAYQELAKGFGVRDYTSLFQKAKANAVRFKTGCEFKKTGLGSGEFGATLLRNLLFAIHETVRSDDARQGLNWLREEVVDYWDKRKLIVALFLYLAGLAHIPHMGHWEKDADAAQRLAGAVENDHEGRL
jgi:putative DNA methylase